MSALDKVLQPVALKFINAFGTSIKYTSSTLSNYDTTSGTLNETDKNQDIKCIIIWLGKRYVFILNCSCCPV